MKFQYILFDLDGTITDPKVGITKSVAYALERQGIMVDNLDTLCKFIGPPLKDSFQDFYQFDEETALAAVDHYRDYFSVKGLYENEMYPGISELLYDLKQKGKRIILATSKPTVFAEKILDYFELTQYFDYIAGSELDLSRSAKKDVIAYALEKCNITERKMVVMIGDRMHDIIGAKHNQISSIGVLYGFGSYEELSEAGADAIVNSISDLKQILLNYGETL